MKEIKDKGQKNIFDIFVLMIVVFTLCFTSVMASSNFINDSDGSKGFIQGNSITALKEKYRTQMGDDVCDDCDDDDDDDPGLNDKPEAFIFLVEPNPAHENEVISFEGYGEDSDGEIVDYQWESHIDGIIKNMASFTSDTLSAGNHDITFTVKDNKNAWSDPVSISLEVIENQAPQSPAIAGKGSGAAGEECSYTFITVDPEQNDVYYYIEWGDGSIEEWIGSYGYNEEISVSHTWDQKGSYEIKAKAKDIYDAESDWGVLQIQMSHYKSSFRFIFQYFFQQFIENNLYFQV
ncbi:MAG: hypothetical protein DRN27_06760 [Thermoplasmata archaeon]|nr:MAG: hypothetical protein DRN27_06760 [Thermoplasmata archaeon]